MFRVGATAVSAFYGDIVKLRIGESGSAYLVDSNGRVIYHTDTDRIADDVSAQAVVQQVLSGQVGAVRTRDFEGRDIVASFAPVPGTSWGLVTQERWAALISPSQGYRQILLLLLALGVLVPVLVVTVGVRRITRPIVELIDAAQEVAKGNFGQTITARTGDEIEELAEQFSLMSAQLQESYAHLEQRVADRTKELATLNAIAAVVSQSLDLDEVLNDALDETLQLMGIEAGGIYLLDEQAGVLTITAQRGFSPQLVAEIDRLKVGEGFSGHVVQTGQPLVVRNVSADPRLTRMVVREEGLQSVAIVPLSSKGKVLGTLFATSRGYRKFTDQDVQLLTSISQQIGVAIENARLFEAEERRAEQFQVISEVGRRMTSLLAVDELLREIARLIRETLGYYLVGIALIEADELIFKAGAGGIWENPRFQPPRLKVGREGITGWVAQSGEPLLVPDVGQEPRYFSLPEASEIRSELAVSLKTKEAVIGVLHVQSDHLNAFDESDLAVLQSLAHQAAIAIENAQLYEQARELAVVEERSRLARDLHDAVTQTLFSASLIAEVLPRIWEHSPDEGRHRLEELRELTRGALAEMRTLLLELRPSTLVEAELGDLLRQLAESITGRARVPVTVEMEGECSLPPEVKVALYRIAQEALNNVAKHAGASQATVRLRCQPEGVELHIRDDGCGFDPESISPESLGLGIMHERAETIGATLTVESEIGRGTEIMVVWMDVQEYAEDE
jgi:nitrate/nitrite-specific signal transduction histidine kinase